MNGFVGWKQEIKIEEFLQVDVWVLDAHARQHLIEMGIFCCYNIEDVWEISGVANEFENGG